MKRVVKGSKIIFTGGNRSSCYGDLWCCQWQQYSVLKIYLSYMYLEGTGSQQEIQAIGINFIIIISTEYILTENQTRNNTV